VLARGALVIIAHAEVVVHNNIIAAATHFPI
jgi:hypothetical protein